MVMARLHVICGNCGCNDAWILDIERDGDDITDITEKYEDSVSLCCGNCATRHNLKDNVKRTKINKRVKVTRYSLEVAPKGNGGQMVPNKNGDWVIYNDVAGD